MPNFTFKPNLYIRGFSFLGHEISPVLNCETLKDGRAIPVLMRTSFDQLDHIITQLDDAKGKKALREQLSSLLITKTKRWNFVDLKWFLSNRVIITQCEIEEKEFSSNGMIFNLLGYKSAFEFTT